MRRLIFSFTSGLILAGLLYFLATSVAETAIQFSPLERLLYTAGTWAQNALLPYLCDREIFWCQLYPPVRLKAAGLLLSTVVYGAAGYVMCSLILRGRHHRPV